MNTSSKTPGQAPSGASIPLHRLGIDEDQIRTLVHAFYARIRADEILGPIFATKITDWNHHLEIMCAFWSSLALTSGRYHGRPMEKHMQLPVDAEHFDRWLLLFEETARAVCTPEGAEYFLDRAHRVAQSFELGIASSRGILLRRTERYRRPAGA